MKQRFLLWPLIYATIILTGILMVFPFPHGARQNALRSSCQSNLKQIGLGYSQYIQDSDNKYPPLSSGQEGWADVLQPYLKSRQIFHCPSSRTNPNETNWVDYFANAQLAEMPKSCLTQSGRTILNGDGLSNSGTSVHISKLPTEWLHDETSPIYKHLDGANFSFAYGHVKWLRSEYIDPAKNAFATFAVN